MYYTIQNNNLIIAETEQALTRFYNNVLPLPSDYEKGKYIIEDGELVLNQNWEAEQEAEREADFDKSFFQTSLGYVRRSVSMADGSHKDFLSDLLPAISMSVQLGASVNILTYDKPPFDHDIDDWTEYQHIVVATQQFIQECFMRLSNDFLPINKD